MQDGDVHARAAATSSRSATSRWTPRGWCWPPATTTRSPTFLDADPRPDPLGLPRPVRRGPQLQHRPHRPGDLPAERRHAHAQHHVAGPGHGRVPELAGSSANCSAASTTRSRRASPSRSSGWRRERCLAVPTTGSATSPCGPSTRTPTPRCCTAGSPIPKAAFWMMQDADVAAGRRRSTGGSRTTRTTTRSSGCGTAGRPSSPSVTTRPTSNWSDSTTRGPATSACISSARRPTRPIARLHARAVITTVMAWLFD